MTTNGHDHGDPGFPMRPDRAAQDTWERKLGYACLFVLILALVVVGVVCGVIGAFWWWD